jgi:hypothetical protein
MLIALSAVVASACVLASAWRLVWAVSPTWLDPRLLIEALGGPPESWASLRDAITACHDATWENDLLTALGAAEESSRIALVNEQLREMDWRAQRWARVPRVCASVATSAGFLFACITLMRGASSGSEDAGSDLVSALDALAIGIAGTSFCFAVHLRVRRIVRERLAAADRLVERLEGLVSL